MTLTASRPMKNFSFLEENGSNLFSMICTTITRCLKYRGSELPRRGNSSRDAVPEEGGG